MSDKAILCTKVMADGECIKEEAVDLTKTLEDIPSAVQPSSTSSSPAPSFDVADCYVTSERLEAILNRQANMILKNGVFEMYNASYDLPKDWKPVQLVRFVPIPLDPMTELHSLYIGTHKFVSIGHCVFRHAVTDSEWSSQRGRLGFFYYTVQYQRDVVVVFYHVRPYRQRPSEPCDNELWCIPEVRPTVNDEDAVFENAIQFILRNVFQIRISFFAPQPNRTWSIDESHRCVDCEACHKRCCHPFGEFCDLHNDKVPTSFTGAAMAVTPVFHEVVPDREYEIRDVEACIKKIEEKAQSRR